MCTPTIASPSQSQQSQQQQQQQQQQQSCASESNDEGNNLLRLSVCAVGICVSYLIYGVIQESLFSNKTIGPTFVLVTQCVTNTLVAVLWQYLEKYYVGKQPTPTPTQAEKIATTTGSSGSSSSSSSSKTELHHPLLFVTSMIYVFAMVCSNEAVQYVSYPVAVLAKSCKMIPIMVMGVLVEKTVYKPAEWIAAFSITCGVVLFNIGRLQQQQQQQVEGESNQDVTSLVGLALLTISLCMDGFLGACQGMIKKSNAQNSTYCLRAPNAVETMLFVNLYSLFFLIPMSILNNNQWQEGWKNLYGAWNDLITSDDHNNDNHNLVVSLILLNGTVALGQIFIFLTITWYSSLMCTTITTTRKFFTILLSVYHFNHTFTMGQWMSIVMVFGGLYSNIVMQQQNKNKQSPLLPPQEKEKNIKQE